MARAAQTFDAREFLHTQGPVTASLDAAVEYARARGLRLLPAYIIGMIPFSVAVLFLIDAIVTQHRAVVGWWCFMLTLAMLWRWIWLARVQQLVQQDIQAERGIPLWRRIGWILVMRLYASLLMSWGGLVVVPAFYGVYAGTFITPLLLEQEGPPLKLCGSMLGWIYHAGKRLSKALFAVSMVAALVLVAGIVVPRVLLGTVLPMAFGVDAATVLMTMGSVTWLFSTFYFVFVFIDFLWTVGGVFLYYDSQSRRTGSDLRARMQVLSAAAANAPGVAA